MYTLGRTSAHLLPLNLSLSSSSSGGHADFELVGTTRDPGLFLILTHHVWLGGSGLDLDLVGFLVLDGFADLGFVRLLVFSLVGDRRTEMLAESAGPDEVANRDPQMISLCLDPILLLQAYSDLDRRLAAQEATAFLRGTTFCGESFGLGCT